MSFSFSSSPLLSFPFFFCRLTDEKDKTLSRLARIPSAFFSPQCSSQILPADGGSVESVQERKSEKLNARKCYIINYRRHIIAYSLDKTAAAVCGRPPPSSPRSEPKRRFSFPTVAIQYEIHSTISSLLLLCPGIP